MPTELQDLRVLKAAEAVADGLWQLVVKWDAFSRDTVGAQMTRAADSIGANVAEAYGRFHYGEKLQFLYYARGSLFETKYWLNRALSRQLIAPSDSQPYAAQLTEVARQVNAFANSLKAQRRGEPKAAKTVRETASSYAIDTASDLPHEIFTQTELAWLNTVPETAEISSL